MRKRTWQRIWEGVGITLFIIIALAVMTYVGLLIADMFTVDAPNSPF
jgi:hypothetical protein